MIIRRRTYGSKISSSYGYFMMHKDLLNSSGGINVSHTIYTQGPGSSSNVGAFPSSYVSSDVINSTYSMCTGYTMNDGTILVATTKYLYKSVDRGSTWSNIGTVSSSTYWYQYFMPVLYASGNKYYLLYALGNGPNPTTITVYIDEWNAGTTTATRTAILSGFSIPSLSASVACNWCGLHTTKVSPNGLCLFEFTTYSNNTRTKNYRIIYIPGKKIGPNCNSSSEPSTTMFSASIEGAGMWINDNTTYGAWVTITSTNGGRDYLYRKVQGRAISTGNETITTSDIKNTISGMFNTLVYPLMMVASSDSYKNLLFWLTAYPSLSSFSFWTTSADFSSSTNLNILLVQMTPIPDELYDSNSSSNYLDGMACSGVCVTPDGRFGLALGSAAIIVDLNAKKVIDGYNLRGTGTLGNGELISFMVPRITL